MGQHAIISESVTVDCHLIEVASPHVAATRQRAEHERRVVVYEIDGLLERLGGWRSVHLEAEAHAIVGDDNMAEHVQLETLVSEATRPSAISVRFQLKVLVLIVGERPSLLHTGRGIDTLREEAVVLEAVLGRSRPRLERER